ncbi:MAG: 4-hydroxy-tetrahydrodipicolinate synthase [Lachnospiraceae bacterium]|nr:4-hydroxy-tetrahydrodipicolinate synthase [Lachnospiraceae bacterium]
MAIFKGAGVAIATPFQADGSVDYKEFDRLIEFQIENGTDAIIVCGTTGESSTMSEQEHIEVVRHCIERVAHRVPVIAGAGSNATHTAVELSKEAEAYGADAILSVTPYYNKATQEGLFRHYSAVSEAVNIPIIVYNVPGRTNLNVLPETMARLVKETAHVRAVKDATGDLAQCAMMMELAGETLEVFAGNDDVIVPTMALGGLGVISVLSNIAPKQTHDMCAACLAGDYRQAAAMQKQAMPLIKALFMEVNPIPVKKALSYLGYRSAYLRLPLTDMSEANAERLKSAMEAYGLL